MKLKLKRIDKNSHNHELLACGIVKCVPGIVDYGIWKRPKNSHSKNDITMTINTNLLL